MASRPMVSGVLPLQPHQRVPQHQQGPTASMPGGGPPPPPPPSSLPAGQQQQLQQFASAQGMAQMSHQAGQPGIPLQMGLQQRPPGFPQQQGVQMQQLRPMQQPVTPVRTAPRCLLLGLGFRV